MRLMIVLGVLSMLSACGGASSSAGASSGDGSTATAALAQTALISGIVVAEPAPVTCPSGAVISLRDYGGVADDAGDDSAALQAAIDAASDGQTVVLSAGEYLIRHSVHLKTGVNLCAPQRAKLTWVGSSGLMLDYIDPALERVGLYNLDFWGMGVTLKGAGHVVKNNLFESIVNAGAAYSWSQQTGLILADQFAGSVVSGNVFHNIPNGTAIMAWNLNHSQISGNTFDGIYEAIHIMGVNKDAVIADNRMTGLSRMGIEVQGSNETGLQIVRNSLTAWSQTLDQYNVIGLSIVAGQSATISGNYIDCGRVCLDRGVGWGIELAGEGPVVQGNVIKHFSLGIGIGPANSATIRSNSVERVEFGIAKFNSGMVVANLVIDSNQLENPRNYGIGGSWAHTTGAVVSRNLIRRTIGAWGADAAGSVFNGIELAAAADVSGQVTVQANAVVFDGINSSTLDARGICICGAQGAQVGLTLLGNGVLAKTEMPAGAGLHVNSPGADIGVVYANNVFERLVSDIRGPVSVSGPGGHTAAGNLSFAVTSPYVGFAQNMASTGFVGALQSSASKSSAAVGDTIAFSAGAASAVNSMSWFFGDGGRATSATAQHAYSFASQAQVAAVAHFADGSFDVTHFAIDVVQ
jgi:hypothetical protein